MRQFFLWLKQSGWNHLSQVKHLIESLSINFSIKSEIWFFFLGKMLNFLWHWLHASGGTSRGCSSICSAIFTQLGHFHYISSEGGNSKGGLRQVQWYASSHSSHRRKVWSSSLVLQHSQVLESIMTLHYLFFVGIYSFFLLLRLREREEVCFIFFYLGGPSIAWL